MCKLLRKRRISSIQSRYALEEGNKKLQQADQRVTEITDRAQQRAQDVDKQLAILRVATEKAQTQISSLGQSVQKIETRLGGLSARYETGNKGPGTVSSGAEGKSYGTWSMSLAVVFQFVDRLEPSRRDAFAGSAPGSAEFDAAWRALAASDPDRFGEEQRKFVEALFFEPATRILKDACGLDVKTRSNVLQDVIWSRAVQTGPRIPRVLEACRSMRDAKQLDPSDKNLDERLIREIYRLAIANVDIDFGYVSPEVKTALRRRFEQEQETALKQLVDERARRGP